MAQCFNKLQLLLLLAVSADSRLLHPQQSDSGCSQCQPGTLCLAWSPNWWSGPGATGRPEYRIRLHTLQQYAQHRLAQCRRAGRPADYALVSLPLASLLQGSPRLKFALGPTGDFGGGESSQVGLAAPPGGQRCAHFWHRPPPAVAVARRLCGGADGAVAAAAILMEPSLAPGGPTAACGFCPHSPHFDVIVGGGGAGGCWWQFLLPALGEATVTVDITATVLSNATGQTPAQCPFRCDNLGSCIDLAGVCDGRVDCPDGADEAPLLCREFSQRPADSKPPSNSFRTVWWAIGISLSVTLVLACTILHFAFAFIRRKNIISEQRDAAAAAGKGDHRADPARAAADRKAAVAAAGGSLLGRQLLSGRSHGSAAAPPAPLPPVLVSRQWQRQRQRQQPMLGGQSGSQAEDSGCGFVERAQEVAPANHSAAAASASAASAFDVDDSGNVSGYFGGGGDGGDGGWCLDSLARFYRGSGPLPGALCVPRIPNRNAPPAAGSAASAGGGGGQHRRGHFSPLRA